MGVGADEGVEVEEELARGCGRAMLGDWLRRGERHCLPEIPDCILIVVLVELAVIDCNTAARNKVE